MAKLSIVAGATSQSVNLFVQDSSSSLGLGLGAIAPAGGSLLTGTKAYYSFTGANAGSVSIPLSVLAAVNSAYSSGGIVTIDDTNMKGWVRLDLPNAVLAANKGRCVSLNMYGGTNMAQCPLEIELTGCDNQDSVHFGITALPNAAAAASGGLIINGNNAGNCTIGNLTTGTVATGNTTIGGTVTVTGAVALQSTLTVTGAVACNAGVTFTSSTGNGFTCSSTGSNGHGLAASGNGTGDGLNVQGGTNGNGIKALAGTGGAAVDGIHAEGGSAGYGMHLLSGLSSGATGLRVVGQNPNSFGAQFLGAGTGAGLAAYGGATGPGGYFIGGGTSGAGVQIAGSNTSGAGILITTTAGDGIDITPTAGHGINIAANGTSKHGIFATGGTAGTSDGLKLVAGSGGVGFQLDTLTASGAVALSSTLTVTGLSTLGGMVITTASGDALSISSTGANGNGIKIAGNGSGDGLIATGGATGNGLRGVGGTSSGAGARIEANSVGGNGMSIYGAGTGVGVQIAGGTTGAGLSISGGSASGDGIDIVTTSGHGISVAPVGTNKHGVVIVGGNGGTSDGLKLTGGTGGVGFRSDLFTVTGAVVFGATWTVTGATTLTGAVTASNASNNIVGIDVAKINAVATTSVTAINANIGTTQPVNFTGTGGSALVKSDAVDAGGVAFGSATLGFVTNAPGIGSVTVGAMTAPALAQFFSLDSGTTYSAAVAGSVVKEIADNAGGSSLTTAAIATAVWQDLTASGDFSVSGSVGKLLVTDIDATISSRSTFSGGNVTIGTGGADSAAFTSAYYNRVQLNLATATELGSVTVGTSGIDSAAFTTNARTFLQSGLATPTNITAGTITTVSGNVTGSVGSVATVTNIVSGGAITTSGGKVSGVILVDTLTTYSGNTVQTGDSFARIGATGSGLTSLAPSATALSTVQWTNTLATNLTTLAGHDPGATLASQTNITAGTITTLADLTTTTFAEPSSVPAATATLKDKIGWMALLSRNKMTSDSATLTAFANSGSATVGMAAQSDDSVTYTRNQWA